jgi:hypothetical protein
VKLLALVNWMWRVDEEQGLLTNLEIVTEPVLLEYVSLVSWGSIANTALYKRDQTILE